MPSTLAAEIQRALGPTYGPGGVEQLLRRYHEAQGVPNGGAHAFYAASVGDASKDLRYLMLQHFAAMP